MASLFNTGGADSNKRPALSLFGSTTTTANAPQPLASIAGSSLFGGLGNTLPTAAATTSAPTASLFGASAANPAPGAPVASLFGASKVRFHLSDRFIPASKQPGLTYF